jgi:hypothetical protein
MMFSGFRSRCTIRAACAAARPSAICSGFDHFPKGKRATAQDLAQRLALHQFHDDVVRPDVVDGHNIGMIQGSGGPGFVLKSRPPISGDL